MILFIRLAHAFISGAKDEHNLVKFRLCQLFEFLHVQPNDQFSWQCRFIPVPY